MTAKTKFVRNPTFKDTALNSAPVMSAVTELAYQIGARASGMFGAERYVVKPAVQGPHRCHAIVATGDLHAIRSNALHMTLNKAIGG